MCVCVCAASMVAPPYPGMMYQTSQGMVYAAAPSSALPNGVIFSLSPGQLQLQHAAADSGMSVFAVRLCQVCTLSFKHLFLCVCVCVSLFALCAASIWHGFCNSVLSDRSAVLLCLWCVNSAACVILSTPLLCFFLSISDNLYKH
jgi:hypothetical protein